MRSISLSSLSFFLLLCLGMLSSCNGDEAVVTTDPKTDPEPEVPYISSLEVDDLSIKEVDENTLLEVTIALDKTSTGAQKVNYQTEEGSAKAGSDFVEIVNGEIEFLPDESSKTIEIEILGDEIFEQEESFEIVVFNEQDPSTTTIRTTITIADNDSPTEKNGYEIPSTGYTAATEYPGKELVWADEFEGATINEEDWTFEIGNGQNGWGNNEVEYYRKENAYLEKGFLVIEAKEESYGGYDYTSTRMKTQGKKNFRYGRIDIRAAVPKGQGIWPALWMLGEDITADGWPACGEIDIMELVGHQAGKVHGTVHFGQDYTQHRYIGEAYTLPAGAEFDDEFHVFYIEWGVNKIEFFVDDQKYFEFTSAKANATGQPYPFNDDFFFLFNVAVGGNWPGYPNASTVFPQFMIVDYVRVYQ